MSADVENEVPSQNHTACPHQLLARMLLSLPRKHLASNKSIFIGSRYIFQLEFITTKANKTRKFRSTRMLDLMKKAKFA